MNKEKVSKNVLVGASSLGCKADRPHPGLLPQEKGYIL